MVLIIKNPIPGIKLAPFVKSMRFEGPLMCVFVCVFVRLLLLLSFHFLSVVLCGQQIQ